MLLTHSLSPSARILWLRLLRFTVYGQLRLDVEMIALKYGVLRLSEAFVFFPKHGLCVLCTFLFADFALIVADFAIIVAECALIVTDCSLLDGSACARSEALFSFFCRLIDHPLMAW